MAWYQDISESDFRSLLRDVRELKFRTTLNNAAIGRSGMEIYDGGMLTISNGGLSVTGSATISGTLNADGTINMDGVFIASGEVRLNGTVIAEGDFTVNGPLLVNGDTTFNGTLRINGATTIAGDTTVTGKFVTNGPVDLNGLTKIAGDTTITGKLVTNGAVDINGVTKITGDLRLSGNMNVTAGGKITAGNVTIDPSSASGGIDFANGAQVASAANRLALFAPGGVDVSAVFRSNNQVYMENIGTSSQKANLYQDPATGRIFRSTAV